MSLWRRASGSLIGALLTVGTWTFLGITELLPRVLVALLAFGFGHAAVRALSPLAHERAQDEAKQPSSLKPASTSNVPLVLAGLCALVIAFVTFLQWRERRSIEREQKAASEAVATVPAPTRPVVEEAAVPVGVEVEASDAADAAR